MERISAFQVCLILDNLHLDYRLTRRKKARSMELPSLLGVQHLAYTGNKNWPQCRQLNYLQRRWVAGVQSKAQIEGPFPSSFAAPSTWYALAARPQIKSSGSVAPFSEVSYVGTYGY
jgi:hypothetical protein